MRQSGAQQLREEREAAVNHAILALHRAAHELTGAGRREAALRTYAAARALHDTSLREVDEERVRLRRALAVQEQQEQQQRQQLREEELKRRERRERRERRRRELERRRPQRAQEQQQLRRQMSGIVAIEQEREQEHEQLTFEPEPMGQPQEDAAVTHDPPFNTSLDMIHRGVEMWNARRSRSRSRGRSRARSRGRSRGGIVARQARQLPPVPRFP